MTNATRARGIFTRFIQFSKIISLHQTLYFHNSFKMMMKGLGSSNKCAKTQLSFTNQRCKMHVMARCNWLLF